MKLSTLRDILITMAIDGYENAEIVIEVAEWSTNLDTIDIQERPGQVPHVVLS